MLTCTQTAVCTSLADETTSVQNCLQNFTQFQVAVQKSLFRDQSMRFNRGLLRTQKVKIDPLGQGPLNGSECTLYIYI